MSETKKSNFKYSENHNKILRAVADLMRPYWIRIYENGEEVREDDFRKMNEADAKEITKKAFKNESTEWEEDEESGLAYRMQRIEPPFPTSKEIAEKVGMTPGTVTKHIKQMNLENFRGTAQALIPDVLAALGRRAIIEGKAPEVKLFMQLVGEWEEKSKVDAEHSGEISLKVARKVYTKEKRNSRE